MSQESGDPIAMSDSEWKYWENVERLGLIAMETGPIFMGLPERWMGDCEEFTHKAKYRCRNGHISTHFLKSELRGDLCLACHERIRMTTPEDYEGQTRLERTVAMLAAVNQTGPQALSSPPVDEARWLRITSSKMFIDWMNGLGPCPDCGGTTSGSCPSCRDLGRVVDLPTVSTADVRFLPTDES